MLWGSSALSEFEFRTSLSKILTFWHCVKVKQRYHMYNIHYLPSTRHQMIKKVSFHMGHPVVGIVDRTNSRARYEVPTMIY